jgi:hypothetical protein
VTYRAENGHSVVEPRPSDVAAVVSDPPAPFASNPFHLGAVMSDPLAPLAPAPAPVAAGDPAPVVHPRPLDPAQAELIAGAGALLLLVSLLFLPWFGIDVSTGHFASGSTTHGSEGAWHTLTLLRWLMLVTVVVALLPLLIRPASRWLGLPRRTNSAMAALGCLTALLVGGRVLVFLPDPSRVVDQQAGAILGVLGALLIAFGGLELTRVHGARRRERKARNRTRRASVPPVEPARIRT